MSGSLGVELRPRLIDVAVPERPEGIVLVLHGGASRGPDNLTVSPTQLSVLRMAPVAHAIRRAARGRLAIFRVLNARRGWEAGHTPVGDATWALHRVRERIDPSLPVALVGHSLGGRAALLAGGLPTVRSVVALAPWVQETDEAPGLTGRRILVIHGSGDRVASPERARHLAATLRRQAEVTFVEVRGGGHAMLARRRHFDGLAAQFVALTLLGRPGGPVLRRIEAGQRELTL
ncbi:MAG TPA: hypothetical protein VFN36_03420 [Solirubrobacteraceae bacterium]|nr:hypothetical protein [Solirubrobacteraceae bacterium]